MIAKLSGVLDSSGLDWLIIDVRGVGYHVFVSGRTLSRLPSVGDSLSLMIDTLVRNEQTNLFGFFHEIERTWFRLLLGIQGIGSKAALALLTALSPDELNQAVLCQDRTMITRAEGIGNKLAGRVVAELKDKVGGIDWGQYSAFMTPGDANTSVISLSGSISEAVSALVNLGYRRYEAVEAIAKSSHSLGAEASTETLIRHGLTLLSQKLSERSVHG